MIIAVFFLVMATMTLAAIFPYHVIKIDGKSFLCRFDDELKPMVSHTIGCVILLVGYAIWYINPDDIHPFSAMCVITIAGGIGAGAARIVRWVIESAHARRDLEEMDKRHETIGHRERTN